MKQIRYSMRVMTVLWLCASALMLIFAQAALSSPNSPSTRAAEAADHEHDFDFEFGTWRAHIHRLQHPLTGSTAWADYEGSSIVRKVWGGRANLGELDVSGSAGRIEGLSLRMYNPQTHQWAVSWASCRDGALTPPLMGQFKAGRGEFYNADTLDGKAIYARFIFSGIETPTFKIEQAFSEDGGKTWETNWIAIFTRSSP